MKKHEIVETILGDRLREAPLNLAAKAYAPTNIALCKYWGKRDQELNLPQTNSLSVSLADKGAKTQLRIIDQDQDEVILNNQVLDLSSSFGQRLVAFLDLFRVMKMQHFHVTIQTNIPIAAGFASSACGFASLAKALNELYRWKLTTRELSILARLGSGSACRSLWDGFVEWHRGERADGMDSHGEALKEKWPELCVGLAIIYEKEKPISSRVAMQRTMETSPFYALWPEKVATDLSAIKEAIHTKAFESFGHIAEANANAMHALMLSAWPSVQYSTPETLRWVQKIAALRAEGLSIYYTQDAGPNLKLLFQEKDIDAVMAEFSGVEVVRPFAG